MATNRRHRDLKVIIMLIKHAMWPLGIIFGILLLTDRSCRAVGFNFLGILILIIRIILFILLCFDCATCKEAEEIFFYESVCCAAPLYLVMAALGVFALAVSFPGSGKSMPEIEYKEYDLRSYSKWMQNKVNDTYRWDKYYKRTLVKHHVCSDMLTRLDTLDQFHQRGLNSFESGCCKPPEECKLSYTSPTVWTKAKNQNYTNMDCHTWSNDPTTLCFDCQSCKAAFVQDVKDGWIYVGFFIVIVFTKAVFGCLIFAFGWHYDPNYK